jgi:hypothetical protein
MVSANKVVYGLTFIGLMSCGSDRQVRTYHAKDILGSWTLKNMEQVNYPTLDFKTDFTAVFTSRGDTVYRWRYLLQGDSLILFDVNNSKRVAKIEYLDSAELVFHSLLEEKGKQLYFKENK